MTQFSDPDSETFLARMEELAPFPDRGARVEAVLATFETLGERLADEERARLLKAFPPVVAAALGRATKHREFGLHAFYERVSERLFEVSRGRAVERAQIASRVAAEWLPRTSREDLCRSVPEFTELFRIEGPLPAAPWPSSVPPATGIRSSLAEGRPGSRNSLAEGRPGLGHTHSVARSDTPHQERKLSSSRGLTQEQEGRTLATGRPGSKRPLSG